MTEELTPESARDLLRAATRIILNLEGDYEGAVKSAAEAEGFYRSEMAREFKARRDAGLAVEAARIEAHGATAVQKTATMDAAGMLKLAGEKLEDARDSRRSLWRLIEWAAKRDASSRNGGPAQQRLPDERTPVGWP